MVDILVLALAKFGKDGSQPDPANPDKTRGISLHNTLAKLHEVLMDVRVLHKIVNEKVVTDFQAGFMPGYSTEHCAFLLTETVRARLRAGAETWVLFVDFWKAYDNVSPAKLWELLAKIGFHERVITYLKFCYETRLAHLIFNDSIVDAFEQLLGLCQGGILSCLFFNIFIQSLSNWLEAKLPGVTISSLGGTFHIIHLLFADDMSLPASTRGNLARAGREVAAWCRAHGLRMTVDGTDKTAAMWFPLDPTHAASDSPLPCDLMIDCGDEPDLAVPFTRDYKYVGTWVNNAACPARAQVAMLGALNSALAAVTHNAFLNTTGLSLQRDMLMSTGIGSVLHLLATVPTDAKFEARLNERLRSAVASIFHISAKHIGLTALADMRLLNAQGLLVRAREGFRLSLATSVHNTPAASLLAILHAEVATPQARRLHAKLDARMHSWPYTYYTLLGRVGFDKSWSMWPVPPTVRPWEARRLAGDLAAKAAHMVWWRQVLKCKAATARKLRANPARANRAPPPTAYAIKLHSLDLNISDDYIPKHGFTVPSWYGVAVGSSILGYTGARFPVYSYIHSAQQGRHGLFLRPFWPVHKYPRADDAFRKATEKGRKRVIFKNTACNLCGLNNGDAAHLCTTCTHEEIEHRRHTVFGDGKWASIVMAIATALYHARGRDSVPTDIADAIQELDHETPEGYFITTCIVTGRPWPQASAAANWHVARRLGETFDKAIITGKAGPFADAWAIQARAVLKAVCKNWWTLLSPPARIAMAAANFVLPPLPA
jgi:hypothetical protein